MALEHIEYGSLARSEIMNKNFTYLDNKITESNETIMTSISSILSNIATINTRLGDLTDNIASTNSTLESKIEDYKSKTKKLVNKATMLPKWSECTSIIFNLNEIYDVPTNGYLLLQPAPTATGNLSINNTTITFKSRGSNYDNAAQLVSIPVLAGDVVTSSTTLMNVYFLPVAEVTVEEF